MTRLEKATVALCAAVLACTFGAICYQAGHDAGARAALMHCNR